MKNNKGFTLVELITVSVILAIMSVSVTYGFRSYIRTSKSRASENIVDVIDYGRALAQTSNYNIYINFYYNNKYCIARIYTIDSDNNEIDKETFEICSKQHKIYYLTDDSVDYKSIENEPVTLVLSKSGFKADNYVSKFTTDINGNEGVVLIKETGRAFLNKQ